ncbi:hypothetical protein [Pseudoalteromonas sp. ASV78]|uniref:hypothetical protein n=1 Tax=Pseudoalteromonas sp. ASV78 TaxID=3397851 RepID=UPI0039FD4FE8
MSNNAPCCDNNESQKKSSASALERQFITIVSSLLIIAVAWLTNTVVSSKETDVEMRTLIGHQNFLLKDLKTAIDTMVTHQQQSMSRITVIEVNQTNIIKQVEKLQSEMETVKK